MEDCTELFEKRSSLYSDRPTYTIAELSDYLAISPGIYSNNLLLQDGMGLRFFYNDVWTTVEKTTSFIPADVQEGDIFGLSSRTDTQSQRYALRPLNQPRRFQGSCSNVGRSLYSYLWRGR
jgi:hypothetical protein